MIQTWDVAHRPADVDTTGVLHTETGLVDTKVKLRCPLVVGNNKGVVHDYDKQLLQHAL